MLVAIATAGAAARGRDRVGLDRVVTVVVCLLTSQVVVLSGSGAGCLGSGRWRSGGGRSRSTESRCTSRRGGEDLQEGLQVRWHGGGGDRVAGGRQVLSNGHWSGCRSRQELLLLLLRLMRLLLLRDLSLEESGQHLRERVVTAAGVVVGGGVGRSDDGGGGCDCRRGLQECLHLRQEQVGGLLLLLLLLRRLLLLLRLLELHRLWQGVGKGGGGCCHRHGTWDTAEQSRQKLGQDGRPVVGIVPNDWGSGRCWGTNHVRESKSQIRC